ncbi:transcriptional regulator [Kaistia algarum]|uniref:helix-turn-helix domain-containing protein n=1 Tax=Kaistia algarum TaxID=2083279 RepID=UPI000CE76EF3|nr:helix-turn-helix domain-containing protein [Kaistia algarum]MCX5512239.1 helix-turn-helix domain-containing protein [Kaistia algarum]PPE80334.1 transcriptional regulator [Kaistia algarum]
MLPKKPASNAGSKVGDKQVRQQQKPKGWDRHAIKAEVHRRGGTLVEIARENGLEPSSTKVALRRRHRAGEKAIAAFLGVDPADLWPERYRTGFAPRSLHTAGRHRAASLKHTAA